MKIYDRYDTWMWHALWRRKTCQNRWLPPPPPKAWATDLKCRSMQHHLPPGSMSHASTWCCILYMNVTDLNMSIARVVWVVFHVVLLVWYCVFLWLCNAMWMLSLQVMDQWFSVGRAYECVLSWHEVSTLAWGFPEGWFQARLTSWNWTRVFGSLGVFDKSNIP